MKLGETIVVATKNAGKVREFNHAFAQLGIRVVSMFDYPELPDIVEDGDTFSANARKKARTLAEALKMPVLADDSGLEVERLNGEPGVYSARYSGEDTNDARNNAKLLSELEWRMDEANLAELDRLDDGSRLMSAARFVCVLALYNPGDASFKEAEGFVSGAIIDRPRGEGGFGYDPLFWLPEHGRTMAEMTAAEKQAISHRGRALEKLLAQLK
ncbi:XTP/dITP diphosphatase [Paenibacillus sp. GCM10027626]|uniref:XTP/dITP diphosphatase n=1 Tax=Paenibacillus sp. GCM10027626 TaxID=3273411 RepID=UPI003635A107